jgi:hypothetical protein
MPNDTRDLRTENAMPFPSWGIPATEGHDGLLGDPGLWLTGGASLLLWTALALLLTSA